MPVFDASFFNPNLRTCTPENKQSDPITNCGPFCGNNQKTEYELCRQSYFLKQQNDILEQSYQQSTQNYVDSVQKIIDGQNQQIAQLIKNSEQDANKIENLSLINTILIIALVILIGVFLAVKFFKRKNINK